MEGLDLEQSSKSVRALIFDLVFEEDLKPGFQVAPTKILCVRSRGDGDIEIYQRHGVLTILALCYP